MNPVTTTFSCKKEQYEDKNEINIENHSIDLGGTLKKVKDENSFVKEELHFHTEDDVEVNPMIMRTLLHQDSLEKVKDEDVFVKEELHFHTEEDIKVEPQNIKTLLQQLNAEETTFNHGESDNEYDSSEDIMSEDNPDYHPEGEEGDIQFFREVGLTDSDDQSSSEDEGNNSPQESQEASSDAFVSTIFTTKQRLCYFKPKNLVHPNSEAEAFHLFITDNMLMTIQRYTNRKVTDVRSEIRQAGKQIYHYMIPFSVEEVKACLGLILYAGADYDNFTALDDLWDPVDGKPIYRAVMSQNRFGFFLHTVRFDNYQDRQSRLPNDRLAAVSEVWHEFNENLSKFYTPGDILTVDEQLLGYRGHIPGHTYRPTKPRKYGLKIFWLCEADTGYALNSIIYTGKEENSDQQKLGENVVLQLCKPYENSGREIVTDNFFTSKSLAVSLLQKRLSLLGTIRTHRKEIPSTLRNKNRPVHSTLFVYDHHNKIMLASYIPRKNKVVTLLSSSHVGNKCIPEHANKPKVLLDYNFVKNGVDQFHEIIEKFTCRRKTVRWPLLVFYNMMDVAALNAFLLMKKNGYQNPHKVFLKNLAKLLVQPAAQERFEINKQRMQMGSKEATEIFGFIPSITTCATTEKSTNRLGRCKICSKVCRSKCDKCQKGICPSHRKIIKTCVCPTC